MIAELRLVVERRDGVAVIRATGELDVATTANLHAVVTEHLDRDHALVLDLRGLGFIDSAGVAGLIVAHERAASERARVGIVCGQVVDRMLALTGLDDQLRLLESD